MNHVRVRKLCFIVFLAPTDASQDTYRKLYGRENLALITMDDNGGLPIKRGEERESTPEDHARFFAFSRAHARSSRDQLPRTELQSQSAESCRSARCDSSKEEGKGEERRVADDDDDDGLCFVKINNYKCDRA